MSFKITVSVFKTNQNAWFQTAEQTVRKSADAWSLVDEKHVLTMGSSGTSGSLRFVSDTGESFIACFGVHNQKRWCDVATDLDPNETALVMHQKYYEEPDFEAVLKKQLASCSVDNCLGRKFTINFVVAEGSDLHANLIIG